MPETPAPLLSALDLGDILDPPEPTPPDVLHQAQARLVALLVARGRSYRSLARFMGVPVGTAYQWAQQGAALWRAIGDAPDDAADALADLPPMPPAHQPTQPTPAVAPGRRRRGAAETLRN
ncbi:helix-turn-helix domain-containing protein [Streptomyces sp. IBSNAI002]|uniref:helix-turn-helix domain-containing protein n=1 Tax=Streptomyces sp. IBSNAI002 TaxID=3457500 RepID=UPI003FD61F7C